MLFKSIKEFNNLVELCPFCKERLATGLFSTEEVGLVPKSSDRMVGFKAGRITNNSNIGRITFTNKQATFESIQDNDRLYFNLWTYDGKGRNKIFDVDINSNIITGAPINIRRIIDTHQLSLLRRCVNENCVMDQFDFAYQSSHLVVGTKSSIIYPTTLAIEVIVTRVNGRKFSLITSIDQQSTYLFNDKTLITKLPMLHLHNMSNEETILNKIKLYVLFS